MKIYKQIDNNYIEDLSGQWEITFRISDEQRGIFETDISSVTFSGTGLDDLTTSGTYTGKSALELTIKIDTEGTPDKFRWSIDGGSTWEATGVSITGALQTLQDGIKILFAATTGHTLNESWSFSAIGTAEIFKIESIKKDVDLKNGKLAEDEMTFSISEPQILTEETRTICLEALQFVKDAQITANKRYVGVFIDRVGSLLSDTNLIMAGVVLPEQNWEDVHINEDEWDEIIDKVSDWKFTCSPFFEKTFDELQFEDVVDKVEKVYNSGTGLWETDLTWKNANVENRLGHWYDNTAGSLYGYSVFLDLVNLNKLLKKITDIAEEMLQLDGKGTYNITIDKSSIDGIFRPTRYYTDYYNWSVGVWLGNYISQCYDFPDDDPFLAAGKGILKLGIYADESGGDETDDVSPFINYRNIVASPLTNHLKEPDGNAAEAMLWSKNSGCKTFSDFLYYLANNLGMFLRIYFSSPTDINIKFIGRQSIIGNEVWIKDVNKSGGKVTSTEDNKDNYYGAATYYCSEGDDKYLRMNNNWTSPKFNKLNKGGNALLLTTSPTLVLTTQQKSIELAMMVIPHNMYHINYYVNKLSIYLQKDFFKAPGLHTAIYMKVTPYTEGSPVTPYDHEPTTDYFTTAGVWNVNDVDYTKISDRINELHLNEKSYFERELNIECPFLCCFSAISNPTTYAHYNWNNLKLGSKFAYDGNEYIVNSIEINIENKTTNIKCQNIERYDYAVATTFVPVTLSADPHDLDIIKNKETRTASGALLQYNIVTLNEDGTVSDARSFSTHYKKIYGMACDNYADGEEAEIMLEGASVFSLDWSFIPDLNATTGIPKQKLYLKKDNTIGTSSSNLRITPYPNKSGQNNLFCCVGCFETPNIIKLNFSQQWIIK